MSKCEINKFDVIVKTCSDNFYTNQTKEVADV